MFPKDGLTKAGLTALLCLFVFLPFYHQRGSIEFFDI